MADSRVEYSVNRVLDPRAHFKECNAINIECQEYVAVKDGAELHNLTEVTSQVCEECAAQTNVSGIFTFRKKMYDIPAVMFF